MSNIPRTAAALCLLLVAISSGCQQVDTKKPDDTLSAGVKSYTFDDVAVGTIPPGWALTETNGVGNLATWRVEEASASKAGSQVFSLSETKNSGRTYNLALAPEQFPANLAMSVRLRAGSGSEDQGGGLVWRARDANHYYIARWNPLENNLRAYKVVAGRRSQLSNADLMVPADQWHSLSVTTTGSKIVVALDGKQYLSFKDWTFTKGGLIGLWTKADAATFFDNLEVEAIGGLSAAKTR